MKKFIMAAITIIAAFAAVIFLPEAGIFDTVGIHAEAASINSVDVKLYGLNDWAKEYISIPSSYKASYQLKVTGASNVSYRVISGDSVTVSSAGLIKPKYLTWYWNGGFATTFPSEDYDSITVDPLFGKSVIEVKADGQTFKVNVEFIDYSDVYAGKKMDEYISKNITSSMSGLDKLVKICKYAASFDYSAKYSSATGMIISGGGDCWASTDLIVTMCKKLGIDAWSRVANKDYGAGSGHINAMAYVGGKYYQLDAGYTGEAPRTYSLIERKSLFSYHTYDDGLEVYQYDGKTTPEKLVIPSSIDGVKVVTVGMGFLSSDETVKEIVIPDTVKKIDEGAFFGCTKLKTLAIPASVESIGISAFADCSALTGFTCSPQNKYYTIQGGVLYNKDKTTVVSVPAASYPEFAPTVTTLADYAVYYNNNIKTIKLPNGLNRICEGAVSGCPSLVSVLIPSSVKTIDKYAFYSNENLKNVYYCGSKAQWNAIKTDRETNEPLLSAAITYNYNANAPIPVAGFKSKNRSSDAIRLAWDLNPTADGYIIERKDGNKWVRVVKTYKNSTTEYRISKLKAGTTYNFRIRSYTIDGKTPYYSTYTTVSASTKPSAVSGLKIKGRSGDALRLAWTKNTGADGYIIERKDGANWTRVVKITKNATTECRIANLKAGTSYSFRICAYKIDGKTALYSGYTAISASTNPSAVSGLYIKAANSNAVRLAWDKNTSADGYIIEMKNGSAWTRVGKITKNSTVEFRKSGLKKNTSYLFRVRSYKMSGKTALYSAYNTVTARTAAASPTNQICIVCNGSGKCVYCSGTGKCELCRGTGKILSDGAYYYCPNCEGTGICLSLFCDNGKCYLCDGKGMISITSSY